MTPTSQKVQEEYERFYHPEGFYSWTKINYNEAK